MSSFKICIPQRQCKDILCNNDITQILLYKCWYFIIHDIFIIRTIIFVFICLRLKLTEIIYYMPVVKVYRPQKNVPPKIPLFPVKRGSVCNRKPANIPCIYNSNVQKINGYVWQLAVYSTNHLQDMHCFIDTCSKKNKLKMLSKLIFHPALPLPTNFSRRHVFRLFRIPNDKYIIFVFIFNSTGADRFLCNEMCFFFTFLHCARHLCWTVWISLNAMGAPWEHTKIKTVEKTETENHL